MYKIIALILVSVLSGCATVSTTPPRDSHCDQLATYSRGIEVLKQVGVTPADVSTYTSQPVVAQFPMQRVRTLVYLKTFKTPADTYNYFYDMCTTVGYNNLMAALDDAEQRELNELKRTQPTPTHPTPKKKMKKRKTKK